MTHKRYVLYIYIYIYFDNKGLFDNLALPADPVLTASLYLQPSLPPGRSLSFRKCAQLKRAECLERASEGPFPAPV